MNPNKIKLLSKKSLTSRITIDPILSPSFVLFRYAQSSTKAVLSMGRVYEALAAKLERMNPEQIDKKALWFLVPILSIFTCIMFYAFISEDVWTTGRIIFIAVCIILTILLTLTLIDQSRFWWAPRIIAFMLFLPVIILVSYVYIEDISLGKEETIGLTLSIFTLGIPSLLFFLWGSSGGKNISVCDEVTTNMQLFSYYSGRFVVLTCLAASIYLGVWLLINAIQSS